MDAIVARRHDSKLTERWYEDRDSDIENRLFEPEPETTPEAEDILAHMTI